MVPALSALTRAVRTHLKAYSTFSAQIKNNTVRNVLLRLFSIVKATDLQARPQYASKSNSAKSHFIEISKIFCVNTQVPKAHFGLCLKHMRKVKRGKQKKKERIEKSERTWNEKRIRRVSRPHCALYKLNLLNKFLKELKVKQEYSLTCIPIIDRSTSMFENYWLHHNYCISRDTSHTILSTVAARFLVLTDQRKQVGAVHCYYVRYRADSRRPLHSPGVATLREWSLKTRKKKLYWHNTVPIKIIMRQS